MSFFQSSRGFDYSFLSRYSFKTSEKRENVEILSTTASHCEGAVASWLVRSTPERALRVRALAGDIVLCS